MSGVIVVKQGQRRAVIAAGLRGGKGEPGDQGEQGLPFQVDAQGLLANRSAFDAEPAGFSYLAIDTGELYFREGAAGGWSAGVPFQGPPGDSAYQVAVENGFVGTEAEWLAALQGDPGEEGRGITSLAIDINGHLIVTYTDTTQADLGLVVGADGANGTNGTNGADGRGIASMAIDGSNHLIITYDDTTTEDAGLIPGAGGSAAWGSITGALADQTDLQTALNGKVNTDGAKVLSDENYTAAEKSKLGGVAAGATANADTDSLAEGSTNLYFTAARVRNTILTGLSTATNIAITAVDTVLDALGKLQAQITSHFGVGGSTHPAATTSVAGFQSAADKTKLDGIATGATANPNTDSLAEGVTNKYFTELRVLATLMSGFTLIAGGTVLAADSLLVAIGKLQQQINDLFTGKQDTLVSGTNIKTVNGSTLLGAGDLVVSAGATLPVVQALSSTRNLGLADINTFNVNSTTNNYTSTIPAQASVAWTDDAEIHFLPDNTGDITITAAAGVSLNGVVAGSVTLGTQNGGGTLKRKGLNNWWVGGALGTLAEQRDALGLMLQASQNDSTAGRVMTVPAFGFGATAANNLSTPDDALGVANGLYNALGNTFADAPYGTDTVYISHQRGASSAVQMTQRAQTAAGAKIRVYTGGAWTAWAELWSSRTANAVTVDTGSFGYGVGSGGTVTQATSKATGVTLNKPSGQITTAADALAANTAISFTLTNNKIAANDIPTVVIKSGATAGAYVAQVDAVAAGSCRISIRNMTAGSLSETLVLQFNIGKGAIA